jgi:hypothetical protein
MIKDKDIIPLLATQNNYEKVLAIALLILLFT